MQNSDSSADSPGRTDRRRRLVRALGAASVGIGVPMSTNPRGVARLVGIDDDQAAPGLVKAVGVRELVAGSLLLVGPPGLVWARVAGDVLDLTVLGRAMDRHRGRPLGGQLTGRPTRSPLGAPLSRLLGSQVSTPTAARTGFAVGRQLGGKLGARRTAELAVRGGRVPVRQRTSVGAPAIGRDGERLGRATLATAAVAGLAAVDVYAALRSRGQQVDQRRGTPSSGRSIEPSSEPSSRRSSERRSGRRGQQHGRGRPGPMELQATVTVNKAPEETYSYWRDFTNLPTFMLHLRSVTPTGAGGTRSRWEANAPLGRSVTWEAEMTGDEPGRRISWKSLPGSRINNAGTVHFAAAPGDRGTEVKVVLHYDLPGGRLGQTVAKLLGEEPEQQVRDDLRRFKQVLETGDVVRSDGLPHGTDARFQLAQRPAQPVDASFDLDSSRSSR